MPEIHLVIAPAMKHNRGVVVAIHLDGQHVHTIEDRRFTAEFGQTIATKWLRKKKLVPPIFNGESLAEHCKRHGIKLTTEEGPQP